MLLEPLDLCFTLLAIGVAVLYLVDLLFPGKFLAPDEPHVMSVVSMHEVSVRNLTSHTVELVGVSLQKVLAFQTVKISCDSQHDKNHIHLMLRTAGEEYQYDYSFAKPACHDLFPSSKGNAARLTVISIPDRATLAIFSSANPASWMKWLKDDTPISGLSIPGTHNAPAYHFALPSVRCQAVSPKRQLENGVRFFDIRARPLYPDKEELELCHSIFPVSLVGRKYFRTLVDTIFEFLQQNPSETVLMTVKREGLGSLSDQQLSKILHDHYANDPSLWFTAPRIPYLGEARGKIVLIRRFNLDDSLRGEYGGAGWCIDAGGWADNTPDALCPSGDIRIQDFYQVMNTTTIPTKTKYVTDQMVKSSAVVTLLPPIATAAPDDSVNTAARLQVQPADKQPIFMNFLTASNFFNPMCWPERIAAKLNPHVLEYLCTEHNNREDGRASGDGCTGIVVCDWVGHKGNWDLVRAIVGWNARLEYRERATPTV